MDKEKAVEIAMAWMQAFYGEQVGTIESQELKTKGLSQNKCINISSELILWS